VTVLMRYSYAARHLWHRCRPSVCRPAVCASVVFELPEGWGGVQPQLFLTPLTHSQIRPMFRGVSFIYRIYITILVGFFNPQLIFLQSKH